MSLRQDQQILPSSRARAAAGGALQATSQLMAMFLGLLLMGFLTRTLGVRHYGLYSVAMVFMNWFTVAVGTVGGAATVRLVAGDHRGASFAVTMLQLMGIAGLVVGGGVGLLAGPVAAELRSPELASLIRILAGAIPINALVGVYSGILSGQARFGAVAAVMPLGWGVQLACAVVLVGNGWEAQGAVTAVLVAGSCQLLLLRLLTGIPLFSRQRVSFKQLWCSTQHLAGMQLAVYLVQSMDLIALKYFSGSPLAIGFYAGAQNIATAGSLFFNAASNSMLQSLARNHRDDDHTALQRTATLLVRSALVYGGLLATISILAPDIVTFLLGKEFSPAGQVLRLLLWVTAFRTAASAARLLIAAAGGKTSLIPLMVLLFPAGLTAFALFIPNGGTVAAALVSLLLACSLTLLTMTEGLKLAGIAFPWVTLVRVSTAGGGAALLSLLLPGESAQVIIRLLLVVLFYGVFLLLLGEQRPRLYQVRGFCRALLHQVAVRPSAR
jgi:O-antigen/teichoic acid export membrane protein